MNDEWWMMNDDEWSSFLFLLLKISPLDPQIVDRVTRILESGNPVSQMESFLKERYEGHGTFSVELAILLDYCMKENSVGNIREKMKRWVMEYENEIMKLWNWLWLLFVLSFLFDHSILVGFLTE